MGESIITKLLESKQPGPYLKRLLSILFVASTAFMLLRKGRYSTSWVNLSEPKQIISFILEGHYFIPVLVFFLVWYMTKWTVIIFSLVNIHYSRKCTRKIMQLQVGDQRWQEHADSMQLHIEQELAVPLQQEWHVALYQEVRRATKPAQLNELKAGLIRWQKQIDAEWVFGIRVLFFTILYCSTYMPISVWLFSLILMFIAAWLFTLVVRCQLAELLPAMMGKLNCEMEGYLVRYRSQSLISKIN